MKKIVLLFLLSWVTLLTSGQVDQKSGWQYKNATYDVFVIGCDSIGAANFHTTDNTGHLDEASFFNSLSGKGVYFAITAGIVDTGCNPAGLLVQDGHEMHPLNMGNGNGNFYLKPNGYLAMDSTGTCTIDISEHYKDQGYMLAVQSGPMLLTNSQVNPAFDMHSKNKSIRCGVGIYREGRTAHLVFIKSLTPVSFYELTALFKDKYKCTDALTLESGGFCSMHLPTVQKQYGSVPGACRYLYLKLN